MATYYLKPKEEGSSLPEIPLAANETTIGRDKSCDFRLKDESVSRRHATIERHQSRYVLIDHSKNGTRVNGYAVSQWNLRHRDEVVLGELTYVFEEPDPEKEFSEETFESSISGVHGETRILDIVEPKRSPALSTLQIIRAFTEHEGQVETLLKQFLFDLCGLHELTEAVLYLRPSVGLEKTRFLRASDGSMGDKVTEEHLREVGDEGVPRFFVSGRKMEAIPDGKRAEKAYFPVLTQSGCHGCLFIGSDSDLSVDVIEQAASILEGITLGLLLWRGRSQQSQLREYHVRPASGQENGASGIIREGEDLIVPDSLQEVVHQNSGLVGRSEALKKAMDIARKAARTNAAVMIRGETGAGKELFAKLIQRESKRLDQPFVTVNCACLESNLVQSTLFGHQKGAFTGADKLVRGVFEEAHKGTVFLDELGELKMDVQAKLLRVLQEGEITRLGEGGKTISVDVRIIAATNKDLQQAVKDGTFREDLFFRLQVLEIYLPPLRDRLEDIPELAIYFLRELARENNKRLNRVSEETMRLLCAHRWPGNVRELRGAIERGVVFAEDEQVELTSVDLPDRILQATSGLYADEPNSDDESNLTLESVKKKHIQVVLAMCEGKKASTAKKLGISRATLYSLLEKYGLKEKPASK